MTFRADFDTAARWTVPPPRERLMPQRLVDATLGGMQGVVEPEYLALIVAWCIAGIATNLGELRARVDAQLLIASAMFAVVGVFVGLDFVHTANASSTVPSFRCSRWRKSWAAGRSISRLPSGARRS